MFAPILTQILKIQYVFKPYSHNQHPVFTSEFNILAFIYVNSHCPFIRPSWNLLKAFNYLTELPFIVPSTNSLTKSLSSTLMLLMYIMNSTDPIQSSWKSASKRSYNDWRPQWGSFHNHKTLLPVDEPLCNSFVYFIINV